MMTESNSTAGKSPSGISYRSLIISIAAYNPGEKGDKVIIVSAVNDGPSRATKFPSSVSSLRLKVVDSEELLHSVL